MKNISIVGVDGSGKTVLMTALGNKYQRPDKYGLFLSPENVNTFSYVLLQMDRMRHGQWPGGTVAGQSNILLWGLFREIGSEKPIRLCNLSFLDFAGEIYRLAFGSKNDHNAATYTDKDITSSMEQLKNHIKSSDTLIVLVNLKDIINGDLASSRTREAMWLSKGIIDYATEQLQLPHIALVFTQADAYRKTLDNCGGLQGAYRLYLPHVAYKYPNLPLLAVSAVNRTIPDENGIPCPAEGFRAEGLDDLMEWILSSIPGCDKLISTMKEAEQKTVTLLAEANRLSSQYLLQFYDETGRRGTLDSLEQICKQLDATMQKTPKMDVNIDGISSVKNNLSKYRKFDKALDSVMEQATQIGEQETASLITSFCNEYRLNESTRNWLIEQVQDAKLEARQTEIFVQQREARQRNLKDKQRKINEQLQLEEDAFQKKRKVFRMCWILGLLTILILLILLHLVYNL